MPRQAQQKFSGKGHDELPTVVEQPTVALGDARILKSEYDVLAKILAQVDKKPEDIYVGHYESRIRVENGHVVRLDLGGMGLKALPGAIERLVELRELDVSDNGLTTIPKSIGRLVELEVLKVSGNQLTVLPESIGGLGKLRELGVSDNGLTTIPESILRLGRLEELDLRGNPIEYKTTPVIDQLKKRDVEVIC